MQLNELDEYNCSNRCINGIFIDPLSDGRHERGVRRGWREEGVTIRWSSGRMTRSGGSRGGDRQEMNDVVT